LRTADIIAKRSPDIVVRAGMPFTNRDNAAVTMSALICASTPWVSLQRAGFAALGGGVHHGGLA